MKPLMPDEVRQAVHGRWKHRGDAEPLTGVSIDSRSAGAGELFIAIRGTEHDGHAYLAQAAAVGCLAAVVADDADVPDDVLQRFRVGVVGVRNTTRALGELAGFYRDHVPATVVAVTGSNGKTTVKRMIHHILSRRLAGSCGPHSFNNAIGVPLTLFGAAAGDDYVICELGTNALGEIGDLSRIAQPDVVVITSIGASHLVGLRNLAHIAVEKASILSALRDHGLAIVNADSPELDKALIVYSCHTVRFGLSDEAALRLTDYQCDGRRQQFRINGHLDVSLPIPGRHNALNAMAAIAVAQRFGFEQPEAAGAIADYEPADMRMVFEEIGSSTLINDAYNANPASVAAAADVLADCRPRRVMILGDMLELGDQTVEIHRRLGCDLVDRGIDLLIGVGPLGRYIAKGAAEACKDRADVHLAVEALDAAEDFRSVAGDLLSAGDTVLLKGSRGAAMERLVDSIREALRG